MMNESKNITGIKYLYDCAIGNYMNYSWVQIFGSHEYIMNGNISYRHICDVAKEIRRVHSLVDISTNCVDVAAKISSKNLKDFSNSDITKLSNLRFLFLEELGLDNIFPTEQLKLIEIINCWNNEIDSLVPIKNMTKLKELNVAKIMSFLYQLMKI